MDEGYLRAMKSKGVSRQEVESLRRIKCPNCGFEFSMVYARAIACKGCSMAVKDCPKVRCAKCDHAFYIKEMPHMPRVYNKEYGKYTTKRFSSKMTEYYRDTGQYVRR